MGYSFYPQGFQVAYDNICCRNLSVMGDVVGRNKIGSCAETEKLHPFSMAGLARCYLGDYTQISLPRSVWEKEKPAGRYCEK